MKKEKEIKKQRQTEEEDESELKTVEFKKFVVVSAERQ